MKKTYEDYIALYESAPCKLLRSILKQAEDDDYKNEMSPAVICNINKVIRYFNEEKLHSKYTEEEFSQKLKADNCIHENTKIIKVEANKAELLECKECGHTYYQRFV